MFTEGDADAVSQCPECGSDAISKRGMTINGNCIVWDDCLNCDWEDK